MDAAKLASGTSGAVLLRPVDPAPAKKPTTRSLGRGERDAKGSARSAPCGGVVRKKRSATNVRMPVAREEKKRSKTAAGGSHGRKNSRVPAIAHEMGHLANEGREEVSKVLKRMVGMDDDAKSDLSFACQTSHAVERGTQEQPRQPQPQYLEWF
jgi:hypothetical protein